MLYRLATLANLRCLNVRQPWASLLVQGIKTIENRPRRANKPYFSQRMGLGDDLKGEWVLIIASKKRPTQKTLLQALNDFQNLYGKQAQRKFDLFKQRHGSPWSLGCIIGVVRFNVLVTPQLLTTRPKTLAHELKPGALKWYHGTPYVGWHVCDAIAFSTPIPNIPGCLTISRINRKGQNVERHIRNAISAIANHNDFQRK